MSKDILTKIPTEMDLVEIANNIGNNWEMLAPYLFGESEVLVHHIKMDDDGSAKRIYQLLLKWRQWAGNNACLGELFYRMQQAGNVMIEWGKIAEHFGITQSEIDSCKDGYTHLNK